MARLPAVAALLLAAGLLASPARAVTVSLVPQAGSVGLVTPVGVDVRVTGLGAAGAPSVGAATLSVRFDPARLEVSDVVFGSALGDPGAPIELAEVLVAALQTEAGRLDLSLSSLLPVEALDQRQGDGILLATVWLVGVAEGTSALDLALERLGDGFGQPLGADLAGSALVVVPEPGAGLLAALGLAFLSGLRRTR